ncbi:hypothetical protein ACFQY8_00035 [Alloscardovia venturai]|uniref:Uncharacterized protein n=1 Tax=Alloscardovia venturai TaxID=1769421 RepID=A0ABW2Y7X8_9BIFI
MKDLPGHTKNIGKLLRGGDFSGAVLDAKLTQKSILNIDVSAKNIVKFGKELSHAVEQQPYQNHQQNIAGWEKFALHQVTEKIDIKPFSTQMTKHIDTYIDNFNETSSVSFNFAGVGK